jgi:ABC-2 type transport system ATP-binding protein
MAATIEAQSLSKRYGKTLALDGLDLVAERGEVVAVLGPNGAGKTTFVRAVATLLRLDAGTLRVAGHDVAREPDAVRGAIGLAGQFAAIEPAMTGRENLEMVASLFGQSRRAAKRSADAVLEQLGLTEAADRLARTYSGGMRRRLDVALGLVNRPQVLFLDEPTTGLDPEARTAMWREIERLAGQEEMTILLTTHYLDEADRLADQLAIADRGRIVAQGTPDALKSELRGDAIQVELADVSCDGHVEQVLRGLPGLREIVAEDRLIRARAERGASAIPSVLGALERDGLAVSSVTLARPSLDDVYLRYAGHLYEEQSKHEKETA